MRIPLDEFGGCCVCCIHSRFARVALRGVSKAGLVNAIESFSKPIVVKFVQAVIILGGDLSYHVIL